MNITLGSDPELMIYGKGEGRIVSALRVLGTDKHNPISLENGVKIYADNALIEASMPPESSVKDMVNRLRDVFIQMARRLGDRYTLAAHASATFDPSEMEDERLWEIGCNPNFDAYLKCINPPIPFEDTMRTGSFHIHIGHEAIRGKLQDNPNKESLIRILDIYLGCASVIFDMDETTGARRRYYGKAGEFRPTEYGVEYRVLGNWSLRSPETTSLCFELAEYALKTVVERRAEAICNLIGEDDPQEAINSNNVAVATSVLLKANTPNCFLDRISKEYDNNNMAKSWGIYD